MKKFGLLLCCMLLFVTMTPLVKAEDVYYTNTAGVEFTEEQYDYITNMFWDGYQEYVTQELFDQIDELGLFEASIERYDYLPDASVQGTMYQNGRYFSMSISCSTNCFVSLGATWAGTPSVTSWDVIGARVDNSSITQVNGATVTGTNYGHTYITPKYDGTGFGFSVELPSGVSNLQVTSSFFANVGGTVSATYQHAMSNTTEPISKLYNIVFNGYGGVFHFYGNAFGKYDGCNGLSATLQ